jgi:hypothetical protein
MDTSSGSWKVTIRPSSISPSGRSSNFSSRMVSHTLPPVCVTLTQLYPTDPTLTSQILSSPLLLSLAARLSELPPSSSSHSQSEADDDTGSASDDGEGGEGEIRVLARRVLELCEGGI